MLLNTIQQIRLNDIHNEIEFIILITTGLIKYIKLSKYYKDVFAQYEQRLFSLNVLL